ncbi:MAG: hypothetical protein ACRDGI_11440 [Candidatus Limnocylindrales bacterium]
MTPTDDQIPQPTDPAGAQIPGVAQDPSDESDTEGHSLLNVELGRAITADRAREVSKLDRDEARARDAKSASRGGFFKRLGRR